MKTINHRNMRRVAASLVAGLSLVGMLTTSHADYYRWPASIPVETEATNAVRGVPTQPIMNSPVVTESNVTVSWYGMQGWSTVEASTNLTDYFPVAAVKATAHAWSSTLTNEYGGTASFRVAQTNSYSGSASCSGCHGEKYSEYFGTPHSWAINAILNQDGSFKPFRSQACLPCHTVGMNQPTGYAYTNSPQAVSSALANVGCESCHGSAGWHKYSDHYTIHPAVSIDPKICGSCHQDTHHPTYEEYTESAHALTAHSTSTSCGPCHSATLRMAMLNEFEDRQAGNPHTMVWPDTATISAWTATCATCHDPHSAEHDGQLRNPMYSTNFYTMPSVSDGVYNTTFDTFYNPEIQLCAQCHNSRGARWDGLSYAVMTTNIIDGPVTNTVQVDVYTTTYTTNIHGGVLTNTYVSGRITTNLVTMVTNTVRYTGLSTNVSYSRGPHHSHQYNILVGRAQEDYLPVVTHPHTRISTQCVACHMASYDPGTGTNITGHTFDMDIKGCSLAGCHTSYSEDALEEKILDLQVQQSDSMAGLVSLLSQWATNKAEAILGTAVYTNSLENSWEYNNLGGLATGSLKGPSATASQLLIPEAIRKARFNLYMVNNDGSLGVHNPDYVKFLLRDAYTNVVSEMADIPAMFSASPVSGYAPLTVNFANVPAATDGNWTFGDNGTATGLNPTHVYNTAGQYSVTFTETNGSTITRTAYINVYDAPVISFTADATTITNGQTVTFTNTSSNAGDVWRARWYPMYNVSTSVRSDLTPNQVFSYTYTNAAPASLNVRLQLYTPFGSLNVTSNAFITVTAQ